MNNPELLAILGTQNTGRRKQNMFRRLCIMTYELSFSILDIFTFEMIATMY